ncbi:MAG: DUF6331 family protein [Sporocytophaga sp.]|jgi:hypothetical protein|nr:DUF6331 family protein [Sporocytophaga sp.]
MTTSKGIRIGENKWINWVNNNPSNNSEIIEIDELLISTYDFWTGLETQCVAECCGLDAFSFWEDDIKEAISSIDKTQLIIDLKNVKAELIKTNKTIVSSDKLNNLMDKGVFIQLVDHILTIIENNRDCER